MEAGRYTIVETARHIAVPIRLGARHLDYTLALNPELSIGEAYMNGLLTIEEGSLFDGLEIVARNYGNFKQTALVLRCCPASWVG